MEYDKFHVYAITADNKQNTFFYAVKNFGKRTNKVEHTVEN